jgi:hypothetical protein
MTRQEAIDLALKLLKLAENNNNVNEAALAAQRAQEILNKYNIEKEMLDEASAVKEPDEPIQDFSSTNPLDVFDMRVTNWKSYLGNILCLHNHCKAYISHRTKEVRMGQHIKTEHNPVLGIIGRQSDARTVKYLYDMLSHEVDKLAAFYGKGQGKSWNVNFRYGVVDAIREKLEEAKKHTQQEMYQEVAGNTTALIRLDNAIAKLKEKDNQLQKWVEGKMKLKSRNVFMRFDGDARAQGKAAGKHINMSNKGSLGSSKGRLE